MAGGLAKAKAKWAWVESTIAWVKQRKAWAKKTATVATLVAGGGLSTLGVVSLLPGGQPPAVAPPAPAVMLEVPVEVPDVESTPDPVVLR
jgi:hypothetical protein